MQLLSKLNLKKLTYRSAMEYMNYFMALAFAFVMPLNKKMMPYIIGLWFLTWVLEGNYATKFKSIKNKMLFFAALAFYLFHVVGLLYSKNFPFAVFDIQVKLTLLFAPLVFAGANKIYRTRTNEILLSFVLGNLLAALLCFIVAFARSTSFVDGSLLFDPVFDKYYNRFYYAAFSLFHHASYFAMYLAFSVAIITYFFLNNIFIQKILLRIGLIVTALIQLSAIYFLSSKAGLLAGFLIALIALILIFLKYFRKWAVYMVLFVFLFSSIAGYLIISKNSRFLNFFSDLNIENTESESKLGTDVMRLNVWYAAIQVIEENFIFGVGGGDIKGSLEEKYKEINFRKGLDKHYNAHQQFLETLIGQGIIGLFLLLFLVVIPFYRSIEEKNFLWFAFVFIIFINFLFESVLNTIAGVTFFGFFYGLTTFVKFENIHLKIPFSPPRIDSKIIHEVVDTLNSGWITTGPKTKLFEQRISEYCGSERTLCVSSATSGLKLILRWYGVGPGDEVIVPAYTYSATANVVVHAGAKLVFADVNPHDFNISVQSIEKAITDRTKVIIPVDFSGFPCDYDELNCLVLKDEIKKRFTPSNDVQKKLGRILILSDSAHSLGAEYKGKKTGSLTDISVFSFHAVKNLTTGEGGAIAFNFKEAFDNNELYKQLNILALHGQTKDAFQKNNDGQWKYDIVDAGYKSNMTDILASMGLVELERYEKDSLRKYKSIFDKYTEVLKHREWAILPEYETVHKKSSYHIYPLRIKGINESERDRIMQKISERNVAVNVHFMPVPMFSFYKNLGYNMDDYPVAYKNYSCEITLPVFYTLSDIQVERVLDALIHSVEEVISAK